MYNDDGERGRWPCPLRSWHGLLGKGLWLVQIMRGKKPRETRVNMDGTFEVRQDPFNMLPWCFGGYNRIVLDSLASQYEARS